MSDVPPEVRAKEKITDGTDWRGTVNVSLGDETVAFSHRLLKETELMRIRNTLDMESLTEGGDDDGSVGQTEAQERMLELQQKAELSEDERSELNDLAREVAGETDSIEDALGSDGYYLLMEMGQNTIEPSDEYVEWVYEQSPEKQRVEMGVENLPQPLTKKAVREELRGELRDLIDGQPYPIKIQVGLQSLGETLSVLGNGFQT